MLCFSSVQCGRGNHIFSVWFHHLGDFPCYHWDPTGVLIPTGKVDGRFLIRKTAAKTAAENPRDQRHHDKKCDTWRDGIEGWQGWSRFLHIPPSKHHFKNLKDKVTNDTTDETCLNKKSVNSQPVIWGGGFGIKTVRTAGTANVQDGRKNARFDVSLLWMDLLLGPMY